MDTVAFIRTTTSKKGDLILSFAIEDNRWPGGIRSLILLRCPAHESVFEAEERGISVSMEGEHEDQSDIKGHLLTEFTLDASAKTICLETPKHTYRLDIRKTKSEAAVELRGFLAKMNFDGKARLAGL